MSEVWVFGYGSLIWNPGFSYHTSLWAKLTGWQLRFWQASEDHRGTPEYPGRVATLVPEEKGRVWGRVYQLQGDREEILAYLDHREKGGYGRVHFEVDTQCGQRLTALSYLGGDDNPSFVGPECEQETAHRIRRAVGPSGENLEYLQKLHACLHEFGAMEPHVQRLIQLLDS